MKEISEIFRIESSKKPYSQNWNKKTAFESIVKALKEKQIYLAELKNKPVGFMIFSPEETKKIHISEFWLKYKYQRKGIGRKLLSFVEEKCKKEGFTSIELMSNKKSMAVKFYKKLNYKPKHEFLHMVKRLK